VCGPTAHRLGDGGRSGGEAKAVGAPRARGDVGGVPLQRHLVPCEGDWGRRGTEGGTWRKGTAGVSVCVVSTVAVQGV